MPQFKFIAIYKEKWEVTIEAPNAEAAENLIDEAIPNEHHPSDLASMIENHEEAPDGVVGSEFLGTEMTSCVLTEEAE